MNDKFLDCIGNEVKFFIHSTSEKGIFEMGLNEKYISEAEEIEMLDKICKVISQYY